MAKIFQSEQFRRLLTRLKLGKNFASIIPTIFRSRYARSFSPSPRSMLRVFHWRGISRSPAFRSLSFKFSCSLPCSWGFSGYRRAPNHSCLTRLLGKQRAGSLAAIRHFANRQQHRSWSLAFYRAGQHRYSSRHPRRFCRRSRRRHWLRLQNIASNFISGLVILAERPITIGDRVEVAAGITGQVQQIRARSTVILTQRQHHHDRAEHEIYRFAGDKLDLWRSARRFRIPIGVAYGSDLEKCEECLGGSGARKFKRSRPSRSQRYFWRRSAKARSTLNWWCGARNELSAAPVPERSKFRHCGKVARNGHRNPGPQRDLHFRDGVVRVEMTASKKTPERAIARTACER